VQTPATLWKRCGNAVQSHRTPCGAFILSMLKNAAASRLLAVATLWRLLERRGRVVGVYLVNVASPA